MHSRTIAISLACAAALALVACGGGSSSSGGTSFGPPPTTPSPVPTSAPGQTLTLSASSLSIIAAGATVPVTVSESGYSGAFSVDAGACNGLATASPSSATGPSATISVTALAAGTCNIVISDAAQQKATIGVTVTVTQGVIQ